MAQLLWKPAEDRVQQTNMFKFVQLINERYQKDFNEYSELYEWSITHPDAFWAEMWEFAEIQASEKYSDVILNPDKMIGAQWFPGSRLNFAENLLRFQDSKIAIIFRGEDTIRKTLSYGELYLEVAKVAAALKKAGVESGDRVVGFVPNMPESIIAMLGAVSLGAVWSSCSPDFGIKGVLDRFGQTRPKILFTADGYYFKGKPIDSLERIAGIADELPSLEKIVVIPYLSAEPDCHALGSASHKALTYGQFCEKEVSQIEFAQLPFDHPLYIMYSSGTTGLPKCMVQSGGGVLLHHLKELILHTDLKREDTIFYFTTCGWMMWNWLTSSLAVGATLVLYDGNPFHPSPETLWRIAEEEKISIFGTSAGYIAALKKSGLQPGKSFDLSPLKAILSTGSPLPKEDFHFIYDEIKENVQLASISGGSDLNGCFALGNPMGPVYEGELQCRGLAMKVFAYNSQGEPVVGEQGELVCTAPFPSMPLYFWDDDDGSKYRSAYYERFPGVWTHGDYVEITERGGMIIYGRSDATLNPGGVRIGTSEIYRVVEQMEEIADSIVVGQEWENDIRVILFVKMNEGFGLSNQLQERIRVAIRFSASPRHVPTKIVTVKDIPYTLNMKKVELAVQKIIHNREVTNRDALKNPEALEYFRDRKELQCS